VTDLQRFARAIFVSNSRAALALAAMLALSGCASWFGGSNEEEAFDPTSLTAEQLYGRGLDAINAGNSRVGLQQFELVDQTYPYSTWAVNAQLMLGYVAYKQQRYTDAIGTLDRFIQLHPSHRDVGYAYYLRALSFYEQITDIKRDQRTTRDAIGALTEVVNRFPDSAYGRDAKLKIDLCRDHLAGQEMEIGRYYQREHLYAGAIGRFQKVVDEYQTTNHTAEALHRLTEIYLTLGMVPEAKRTAAVLGYNYPGSEWYTDTYAALVKSGQASDEGVVAPTDQPGLLKRLWKSVF